MQTDFSPFGENFEEQGKVFSPNDPYPFYRSLTPSQFGMNDFMTLLFTAVDVWINGKE